MLPSIRNMDLTLDQLSGQIQHNSSVYEHPSTYNSMQNVKPGPQIQLPTSFFQN